MKTLSTKVEGVFIYECRYDIIYAYAKRIYCEYYYNCHCCDNYCDTSWILELIQIFYDTRFSYFTSF